MNDFIFIVLNWWLDEVQKAIQVKESVSFNLLFMDGPNGIAVLELTIKDKVVNRLGCPFITAS